MTPKEAAIAAFDLRELVGLVPHFELQFLLAHDLLGESHVSDQELDAASGAERDRLIHQNAELYVREAGRLDYCIVPINMGPGRADAFAETIRLVHEMIGDERLIAVMVDPTMSIPNGANMMDLVTSLAERPDEIKGRAAAGRPHRSGTRQAAAGRRGVCRAHVRGLLFQRRAISFARHVSRVRDAVSCGSHRRAA